jgi:hypothetical protein
VKVTLGPKGRNVVLEKSIEIASKTSDQPAMAPPEADRPAQGGCRSTHNAALRRSFWKRESRHTACSWPSAV